jgi:hypothetical protein
MTHRPQLDVGGTPESPLPTGGGPEVQEVILAEEQAHGLHPPDGCNQSVELEETRAHAWDQRRIQLGRY